MQCDRKAPATIPKKVGVIDGFFSTYECTLRVSLAYAVKSKENE